MSRILGRKGDDELHFVAGDRQPTFRSRIRKRDGSQFGFGPDEIVSAVIRIRKRGEVDYVLNTTDNVTAELLPGGREIQFTYEWQEDDITEPGTYGLEVEVLLTDETNFTSPTRKEVTLFVRSRV
jgi:hypothetical protein